MTRKQIMTKLREMGFIDTMSDETTLCAYEQLYTNIRANGFALRDIERLELNEQGELIAIFESGLDYATGYLLEYENDYFCKPIGYANNGGYHAITLYRISGGYAVSSDWLRHHIKAFCFYERGDNPLKRAMKYIKQELKEFETLSSCRLVFRFIEGE